MSKQVSRAVLVIVALAISGTATAAPGDLDTTWGSGGILGINYGDAGFEGGVSYTSTVSDQGGRYYAVGTAVVSGIRRPVITAFLANGTVDTSFGSSGHKVDMGLGTSVQPYAAATITTEYKTVAKYGWEWTYQYVTYAVSTTSAMYVYKVAVYTEYSELLSNPYVFEQTWENGSTPSTWGNGTRATVSFAGGVAFPQLDIDASGTLGGTLLVGTARSTAGGQRKGVAVRLSKTGSLVTTFGSSGILWLQTGTTDMFSAVRNECAVGRAQNAPAGPQALVACFTSSGLNTAFDGDGWKRFSIGDAANPVTLGRSLYRINNGALTIAANVCDSMGGCKIGLARLTSAGAFDTTFSGDGKAMYSVGGDGGSIGGPRILLIGSRYVIAGQQFSGDTFSSMLFAFTSTGAADTTFGTSGLRLFNNSAGIEGYAAIGYAYSGKLIAVGDRDVLSPERVQGVIARHTGM